MVLNEKFDIPAPLELLKTALNRRKWKNQTPLQKWFCFYGAGRVCCKLIKITAYQEDQTLSWISFYPVFYLSLHTILVIYTLIYCTLHGEPLKCLICTCIYFGPVCGMMPVLYIALTKDRFAQANFLALPGRTIYPNGISENADKQYNEICSKSIDESIKSFIQKMLMTIAFTAGAAVWPTYQGLKHYMKVDTIGLKIPFTAENSNEEFFGNLFVFGNVIGHGFFGYMANEIGLTIADDYFAISPKVVKYKFEQFFFDYKKKRLKRSEAELFKALRNIVQYIRRYDE